MELKKQKINNKESNKRLKIRIKRQKIKVKIKK